jgi:hypothetical protein
VSRSRIDLDFDFGDDEELEDDVKKIIINDTNTRHCEGVNTQ